MKKFVKGLTALLISLMMVFGTVSVSVMAEYDPLANLYVYNIYKVSYDADNLTCFTIAVMFSAQFRHYDSSVRIELLAENGSPVAYFIPRSSDVNKFDVYDILTDELGIKLLAEREYMLVIPDGAFYTDGGLGCNEYRHIFTGIDLSGANYNYTIKDLGIGTFFPVQFDDSTLYKGKLYFDPIFTLYDDDNCTVTLSLVTVKDGKSIYTKVADAVVSGLKDGCAEMSFSSADPETGAPISGVAVDKYASYQFKVSYASFYNNKNTFCAESVYDLSGKKLLKLREDYPFIDLLIKLSGKDSKVIDAVLTVLEYVAKASAFLAKSGVGKKLGISDITEYYKDIKAYVKSK
jgi:hypothetical protein